MKKFYIQPASQSRSICPTFSICVGSVHGNAGLEYGGGSDGSDPNEKPF
jgi:hypothetical protein